MKYTLIIMAMLFFSFNTSAQSERQKERFAKRIFKDFRRDRLDLIEDLFVDADVLKKLLIAFDKEDEDIMSEGSFDEIDAERLKAKNRFGKSLESAYNKLADKHDPSRAYYLGVRFKSPPYLKRVPLDLLGIEIFFELDDISYSMRFSMNLYDAESRLFFVMDDKVRIRKKEYVEETASEKEAYEAAVEAAVEAAEAVEEVEEVETETQEAAVEAAVEATAEAVVEEDIEIEEEEIRISNVEQLPKFPGGNDRMYEFISNNLSYPRIAQENGISGRVYIEFYVNKDGSLSDAKIIRDIGGGCGAAALKVVKRMPKWQAGKVNGVAKRMKFTLPVLFVAE